LILAKRPRSDKVIEQFYYFLSNNSLKIELPYCGSWQKEHPKRIFMSYLINKMQSFAFENFSKKTMGTSSNKDLMK